MSPIGAFITSIDTKMLASMDGIVASMQSAVVGPLTALLVLYVAVQCYRMIFGDGRASSELVPNALRMAIVVWLATTSAYATYIQALFFTVLPSFLANAIAAGTGTDPAAASVQSAGDAFDILYHQAWRLSDATWEAVSWTGSGSVLAAIGFVAAAFASACLMLMATIYEGGRIVLGLLITLGPILVACYLFPATRRYAENGIGKGVALLVLGAMTIIISQLMLTSVTAAMTSLLASASTGGATGRMQGLAMMGIAIGGGALLSCAVVPIAYSIGNGIGVRGPSILRSARAAAGGMITGGKTMVTQTSQTAQAVKRIGPAVQSRLSGNGPSPARTRDLLRK